MSATMSMSSTAVAAVDTAALLLTTRPTERGGRRLRRRPSLQGAARFFRRASSRRMMREPSMRVRDTAAEQLEERQSDWAYSRPVVYLDILWHLAFLVVSATFLVVARDENPSKPLRVWIGGYALQCVLRIVCVCIEYRCRHRPRAPSDIDEGSWNSAEQGQDEERASVAKHLESANTMFSFMWWFLGLYWLAAGGQALPRDAHHLYWLCVVFLAFDAFFVFFCFILACIIGIAVCCCLPCIIAILYAVADQEGASDEDIRQLPKYKFRRIRDSEKLGGEIPSPSGGIMTECGSDPPMEHFLPAEDAECCICLCAYEDGVELRELPCGHHFHCACIDKWLYINATCPLCKFNIIKSSSSHGREEV